MKKLLTFLLLLFPALVSAQTEHGRIVAHGRSIFDAIANTQTVVITGTTPSVALSNTFKTNNGGAVSITNFTGGVDAQAITVICGDINTTIKNNATIVIAGGNDLVCTVLNQTAYFIYDASQTKWIQVSGGTSGGGGGAGSVGATNSLQKANGSGGFLASGLSDDGTLLTVPRNVAFKGPNPWIDVTQYGVRAVNQGAVPNTTATITSGSPTATLASASTFINGDGIRFSGAGATHAMSTPGAPTVTPSGSGGGYGVVANGLAGATTYNYQVVACNKNQGCTAASSVGSTTTGDATLGVRTASLTSMTRANDVTSVICAATCGVAVGEVVYIPVTGLSPSDVSFAGMFVVDTVTDTTHFTFKSGMDTRAGATTSVTGGTLTWYVANRVTWTAVTGAFKYIIYGRTGGSLTRIGVTRPLETFWDDYGSPFMDSTTFDDWTSATPPGAATNESLVTTIVSGAGTTTVTLAANAGNNATTQKFIFDNAPNIKAAAIVATTGATAGTLYFPTTAGSTTVYKTNSYLNLASGLGGGFLVVQLAGALQPDDTIEMANSMAIRGDLSGGNLALDSFSWRSAQAIGGAANPLLYSTGSQAIVFYGIKFSSNNGNQGTNLVLDQATNFSADYSSFTSGGQTSDTAGVAILIRGDFSFRFNKCTFGGGGVSATGTTLYPAVVIKKRVSNTDGGTNILFEHSWFNGRGFQQDWVGAAAGVNWVKMIDIQTQSLRNPLLAFTGFNFNSGTYLQSITPADFATPVIANWGNQADIVVKDWAQPTGSMNFVTGRLITGLTMEGGGLNIGQNRDVSFTRVGLASIPTYSSTSSTNTRATTEMHVMSMPLRFPSKYNILWDMLPPTGVTATVSAGGSVPQPVSTTYTVTAIGVMGGETAPSDTSTACVTSSGNQTCTVNWTGSAGAVSYNVYRLGQRATSATHLTTTSYVDTNASVQGDGPTNINGTGIIEIGADTSGNYRVVTPKLTLIPVAVNGFKQDLIAPTLAADSTVTMPNFSTVTLASINNAQTWTVNQSYSNGTEIRLFSTNATNYAGFKGGASTVNLLYAMPTTDATGTQCFSTTAGTFLIAFSACSAGTGTPGGSNTDIQFNSSGTFGGNAKLQIISTVPTFADFYDVTKTAAPANPGASQVRCWADSTTALFTCKNSAGALAITSSLSSLTSAITSNTTVNGDNAQIFNFLLTTASKSAVTFGESGASTATGTPVIVNINTQAASTAYPFQATARGTANGVRLDFSTGTLSAIGTANINATQYKGGNASGTGSCVANQFITVLNDAAAPSCATAVTASTAPSNQFANAISASGVVTYSQPAFSNLSGSIAAGQMPAHTGDVTSSAGSVVLTAVRINGTTVPTNSTADQFLGTTASATAAWATMPNCLDSVGQHMNYNTSTHAFSCGTTSSASGVGGSGTTNRISKWSAATTLADSLASDNGTTFSYTGTGGLSASLVSWTGTGAFAIQGTEDITTNCPVATAGQDILCASSTLHAWVTSLNGGAYFMVPQVGGDLGNTPIPTQVVSTHITGATTNALVKFNSGNLVNADLSGDVTTAATTVATVVRVNGTIVATNATADQFLRTSASAVSSWTSMPNCLDSAGQHINYDTSTHVLSCGTTTGSVASVALSTIIAAAGPNTINNGDNAQIWNWAPTSAGRIAFTFGENTASVSTGTPILVKIATLAASTAIPLRVTARGTANGVTVDATTGTLSAIGTSDINATRYKSGNASGTGACAANQFINAVNDAAAPTCAQPAFTDLSGTIAAAQQNSAAAGVLGAIELDTDLSGTAAAPVVAKVNGTSVPTNAAADQVVLTTASATGSWGAVPSCGDSSHALNYNTGTHAFGCQVLTTGTNPALNTVTAAAGTNTINNGDNAQVWNAFLTTASKSFFTFGENTAGTATGTPILLNVQTLAASTVFPLQVTARGTANGIRVDSVTGTLSAIGSANINATQYKGSTASGTGACASNQYASTLNDGAVPTCSQPALDKIADPAGSKTFAFGVNTLAHTWTTVAAPAVTDVTWTAAADSGTSTVAIFSFLDTTANTRTGALLDVHTVGTSTALPVQFTSQGTSNGVNMTAIGGFLTSKGTGGIDASMLYCDTSTTTKCAKLVMSTIASATTRSWTFPNSDGTFVGVDTTQTLTGKTLTSPIISSISNTGTVTLFTATDTVVGKATTDVLTGKTLDHEGTGNVVTIPDYISFSAACNNATGDKGSFNVPTSGAATFTCSGTTTTQGNADFVDGSTTSLTTQAYELPTGWVGNIDVDVVWYANSASSNAVRWSVSNGCVADSEAVNTGPSYNTASASNTAYTGTANQRKTTSFTSVSVTNCAADESIYFQLQRIGADGGDTLTATAELIEMRVKERKTK